MDITPLSPGFGARITGMRLDGALSSDALNELRSIIDTYSLLHFPNQDMTDDRQLAFTQLLGSPEAEHVTFGTTGEVTYFGTVGNIKDDGTVADATNARYQSGNQLWHSDSSFRETPSYVSILHAYEVPEEGGDTEFVSMRTAYERLSQKEKEEVDPLFVLHDYVFSRSPIAPVNPNHAASLPPVMHPLVRINPNTRAKNLYIGSHARSIVGFTGIESRALLDRLLVLTTKAEFILTHRWTPGDTVIWDNRCTLHRGTGYDAARWRRRLRQTRVVGNEKGVIPQAR
ncbi:MAG: TauD/TfdA dioxygenase family protein [Arenicellales bacterium]|nr:TauD/TfdA family dioxygenase [Gammaproteobacteria bacterium]